MTGSSSVTRPTAPTLEQSLRLAVSALHKQAHALAFEANIYEQHRPASAQMERAYKTYHQLRQAADLLDEQADDAYAASAAERLSKAKVKP
jgi:hypothetical protein